MNNTVAINPKAEPVFTCQSLYLLRVTDEHIKKTSPAMLHRIKYVKLLITISGRRWNKPRTFNKMWIMMKIQAVIQ